jgi:TRAP transporter TAXI family solute receptor
MKKVEKGMVMLGLFSIFILGLGIQDTKAAEFPLPGWPKGVVCASGSLGSLYYVQSVAISELSSKYLKVKATVIATGAGSGQQIDLFKKKEADLGTMADLSVYEACLGIGSYKDKPVKNMRAVAGSFQVLYMIVTDAKYGIKTMEDLKGSGYTVSLRPRTSPLYSRIGDLIYEFYGIDSTGKDVNDVTHTSKAEGFAALREGRIKVLGEGQPEPGPDPYYLETDRVINMRMIPLSMKAIEYVHSKIGGFMPITQPVGLYKGISEPVLTGSTTTGFYGSVDLPEDYIYELTKLIHESPTREEFVAHGPHLKNVSLKRVGYPVSPYHAGAVKYYKEKGVWTDKMEKRQKDMLAKMGMTK